MESFADCHAPEAKFVQLEQRQLPIQWNVQLILSEFHLIFIPIFEENKGMLIQNNMTMEISIETALFSFFYQTCLVEIPFQFQVCPLIAGISWCVMTQRSQLFLSEPNGPLLESLPATRDQSLPAIPTAIVMQPTHSACLKLLALQFNNVYSTMIV